MRRLRLLLSLLLAIAGAVAVPARAQGTRIKDLPLATTIPTDGRIALDASTFTALRGVSIAQLATNLGAGKLDATNGVAVGLTTATVPTSSNSVVNKTALDAAIAGVAGGANKLDVTNGVAVGLTTATVPTVGNSIVNKTALDASAALALAKASNLSDLPSASAARTNLGLGTLATQSGTFSGTSSGVNTGDQTTISGNAGTATALATARAINGVAFDGTAPITVTAAAGTLTGATLASGVTGSSLTSAAGGTFGTAAFISAASKLDATNGVAVGLTTATVPTTGNSVANKTYVDATSSGVAGNTPVQTTSIATLRSFSPTYILVNGQQFTVGGYYSNGDGGGGDFRYDSTDTTSADNGGTIIVAASGARLKRIINGPVNIKAWGAIGDASTDNAAIFRKAVTNTPNLFVPAGTFNVSGEIAIPSTLVITGESSRTAVISASTTNFVFVYQSPLDGFDENSALRISDLYFNAKNALKFGNGTNSFPSQRVLLHGVIKDCYFNGALGLDPYQNTAVVPTEAELLAQGVAIYGAKLFDFTISNLQVQNYGIGLALFGCDINNITDSRLAYNSRHVHLIRYSTYGSQNKVQNCDLLQNYRIGAIYDENYFTSIKDNYFEVYSDAAQFFRVRGSVGTLFWGNRIDCSQSTTPMLSLAPSYDCIVSNNRYNPAAPASTIEVLPTYWTVIQQGLVTFTGNSENFPETRWPQCRYDRYSSPTVWDAWSPKSIGGIKAQSYPWSTNSVTGLPAVQGGSDSFYVYLEPKLNWSTAAIKFSGVSIGGASGYAVVTWGTSNVFSGFLGLTSTNALQTVSFPITRPAGIAPNAQLVLELINSQTAYHSIELVGAGSDKVGTVTSVGVTAPAVFTVTGSPVTTDGTVAIAYSGTALPVANGGTGLTALGAGVATLLSGASSGTGGPVGTTSPTILTGMTLGNGGGNPLMSINGAVSSVRGFDIFAAGSYRWRIATTGLESANAGADVDFEAFSDAGVSQGHPLRVNRSGYITTMAPALNVAASYFACYFSNPTGTSGANLLSRTAAEVRSDIGAGTGSGTVTSVAASVPSFLSIAGSPITTSGTLAVSYSGTALPVANGGTGLTALGTGLPTALGLAPTGSGVIVLATNAVLVTPTLGDASATTIAVASAATAGSVVSFGSITAGGNITGLNLSGSNTGDQTSVSGNAGTATTLATGRTIGITGDLTWTSPTFNGSGNVTAAGTLASSGVAAGAYGSASYIPTITVDAKGRVTSVTTNAVSGGGGGGSGGGNVYSAAGSTNYYVPIFSGATGTNLIQSMIYANFGDGVHIGSGASGTGDGGALYFGPGWAGSLNLFNAARTFSILLYAPGGLSSNPTITFPSASGVVALTSDLPTLGTGVATALAVANNAAGGYSTIDGTATLSNKRITSRIAGPAYAATVTMDSDSYDVYNIGALTGNITLGAPTGTPTDGQSLLVRMSQDATGSRTITFNAAFAFGSDVTAAMMPSGASAKWEFKAVWNSTDSKWRVVGLARGF